MSLVIVDEHYTKVEKYIKDQCDSIDDIIRLYIKTMNNVIEAGFMDGTTSDALKEFLTQVESDFGKQSSGPNVLGCEAERYGINFIKRVDDADKQIY